MGEGLSWQDDGLVYTIVRRVQNQRSLVQLRVRMPPLRGRRGHTMGTSQFLNDVIWKPWSYTILSHHVILWWGSDSAGCESTLYFIYFETDRPSVTSYQQFLYQCKCYSFTPSVNITALPLVLTLQHYPLCKFGLYSGLSLPVDSGWAGQQAARGGT